MTLSTNDFTRNPSLQYREIVAKFRKLSVITQQLVGNLGYNLFQCTHPLLRMGSSNSTTERSREGHQINPSRDPFFFHLIETGDSEPRTGQIKARKAIDSSLSSMKVCKTASRELESTLRNEYFTKWEENCNVAEFHNFSQERLKDLFNKIHDKFSVTGTDIRTKLKGIQWANEWSHKIFEFSFGSVIDSGTIYFGVIALGKEKTGHGFSFDAVTCLYKLDFTIGKEKVTRRTDEYFLGIPIDSHTSTSYKSKSLGFVTQKALKNFCRVKALEAFHKRGLSSFVNDRLSIEDVD